MIHTYFTDTPLFFPYILLNSVIIVKHMEVPTQSLVPLLNVVMKPSHWSKSWMLGTGWGKSESLTTNEDANEATNSTADISTYISANWEKEEEETGW